MNRITLAYFVMICAWCGGSFADDSGKTIADRVQKLTSSTAWTLVREIPLQFDAFHPQGMAIVEGHIFVSSVEVIDRAKGVGRGHIFRIGANGTCDRTVAFSSGASYHAGGMDYDGRWLWVPFAEYRPDSRSVVFKIEPTTLGPTTVFSFPDHLGLLVHDSAAGLLVGASWGSRRFYQWHDDAISEPSGERELHAPPMANVSHYIDLQDGQWLRGTTLMLCGGLKGYRGLAGGFALGGLELIDMPTLKPVQQVPVSLWEPGGRPMLQNAFHAEATEAGLRFYFLPGDGKATIYVYKPSLR